MLRRILSDCTGQDPRTIRMVSGDRGRPYLPGSELYFSLSHSSDVALVAVASGAPVGVDVECVRADVDIDVFARDLLAAPEVAGIDALPAAQRLRAWFQAWTRLEAAAKASGEGLCVAADGHRAPAATLRTWDLQLAAPFVGAVAVA